MARTVIVSNRVSLPNQRDPMAGGLAVAMREALRRQGGIWFGWSGNVRDTPNQPHLTNSGKVTYATVDLTSNDYEQYYLGYANGSLWPLLHYRLGLVDYKRSAFEGYLRVNMEWARRLRPLLRPDDVIWVQDYHLIPFGASLRQLGIACRIGFFLHTPFPPADILEALPHHERLIESLCAYDLVGFQTEASRDAFLGCVRRFAGGRDLGDGAFAAHGRWSQASVFPIGLDAEHITKLAARAADAPETRRLEESLSGRSLIIGVDRLDYSKGIPQRFEAIDSLLSDYPEHRQRVSYLQITPHSRAELQQYRALRRELEALAGRVNGKFAEFDWSPIRYVNKSFSRSTLAGFYRRSRIGLVTPLRDGMNLVAKEFVAAQDERDPGVLILSRFAGAAQELTAALLVNPIDIDEIAAALHRALHMQREERLERWRSLMDAVSRNTIEFWCSSFLSALERAALSRAARIMPSCA